MRWQTAYPTVSNLSRNGTGHRGESRSNRVKAITSMTAQVTVGGPVVLFACFSFALSSDEVCLGLGTNMGSLDSFATRFKRSAGRSRRNADICSNCLWLEEATKLEGRRD